MEQFYTYMWLREDGTPYYIGKGSRNRAFDKHFRSGKKWLNPPSKECIIIYPAGSETDALETEIALIWYYGRKDLGTGCLRNMSDGGEGPSGWVPTEKTRKMWREQRVGKDAWNKGMKMSEEFGAKMSRVRLGTHHTGGSKISATLKGRPLTKSHREKISKSHTGKTHTEETRKKMSMSKTGTVPWNKGKKASEETRRKLSESRKGQHNSPATQFKQGQVPWNKDKKVG